MADDKDDQGAATATATATEEKPKPDFTAELEATGREIVPSAQRAGLHLGRPAYEQFDPQMVALIGKQVMPKGYELAELYQLLELAATYQLDPFTKEIWAVRMGDSEPVTILVGRDGLLAVAERNPDYRGFRNEAVFTNDLFRKLSEPRQMPDGTFSEIYHEFSGFGDRGELVGAYAEVYREGRPPVTFLAPLVDYDRGKDSKTPWKKQRTAMIRKCALANALRLAFRISGLYLEEEFDRSPVRHGGTVDARTDAPAAPEELHEDPYYAIRFRDLFDAVNAVRPDTYLPAKQRLLVSGKTDEELNGLIVGLLSEITAAGGKIPDEPDPALLVESEGPGVDDDIAFGQVEDADVTDVAEPEAEPE